LGGVRFSGGGVLLSGRGGCRPAAGLLLDGTSGGVGPLVAAPRRLASSDRLEVMLLEVLGDLLAEHGSLRVGRAEVDAGPYTSVNHFFERVREPVEAPR